MKTHILGVIVFICFCGNAFGQQTAEHSVSTGVQTTQTVSLGADQIESEQEAASEAATEAIQAEAEIEVEDEVVVYGQRSLGALRFEMKRAEEAMFDSFNKLNSDDRYDIHCRLEAPLGTRIKNQVCRPNFFYSATADDAQATLAEFQGFSAMRGAPPESVIYRHSSVLEEKLREAIEENPEFLEAIQEFDAVKNKYQAARQEKFEEE